VQDALSRTPSPLERYMAPELLQGRTRSADSDVWAAGALLFYMLTGCEPLPLRCGESREDWRARVLCGRISLPWPPAGARTL
jgi:serine/threonine protein kinase